MVASLCSNCATRFFNSSFSRSVDACCGVKADPCPYLDDNRLRDPVVAAAEVEVVVVVVVAETGMVAVVVATAETEATDGLWYFEAMLGCLDRVLAVCTLPLRNAFNLRFSPGSVQAVDGLPLNDTVLDTTPKLRRGPLSDGPLKNSLMALSRLLCAMISMKVAPTIPDRMATVSTPSKPTKAATTFPGQEYGT